MELPKEWASRQVGHRLIHIPSVMVWMGCVTPVSESNIALL